MGHLHYCLNRRADKMNNVLCNFFNLYKNLRTVNEIVNEIYTLDHYVYNYVHDEAIECIDFCVKKYNKEIKQISSLKKDIVVVDNDPTLYESKDEQEINSDVEYIRDCLIIIGTVKVGFRQSIRDVMIEAGWIQE